MTTPVAGSIAVEAYLLWERHGRPEGRAVEFWLAAEENLRAAALLPSAGPAVSKPSGAGTFPL